MSLERLALQPRQQLVKDICAAMAGIALSGADTVWDPFVGGTGTTVCETLGGSLERLGVPEALIERFFTSCCSGAGPAQGWLQRWADDCCSAAVQAAQAEG